MSIVVCSFQQAPYLRQALRSLVEQRDATRDELEILVIDGGSKDGSVEIIREFEPYLAYWTNEPDRGQTHALKKGFARSTGDIQGWLCSDDLLEPHTVRQAIDFFDRHRTTRFCYANAWFIDPQDQVILARKEIPFSWFIWRYDHNYIPQPSAFWHSAMYEEVGGLDERFDLAMDADLFAKFAELTRPIHVPAFWSRMRCYPEQKTQRMRARCIKELREISRRHGALVENPATRLAGYVAAKGWRWSWKLATGCYW
jgi:glycosyltransferase involved in cell wall biosynthesis